MTDTLSSIGTHLHKKDRFDISLFLALIVLGFVGVVMVYGATKVPQANAGLNSHYFVERQAIFVVLGIAAMYVVSLIDYRRLEIVATPFYVIGLLS